jgi:hypothetical protein
MQEQLVTFEIAKLAKEKGFDGKSTYFYFVNGIKEVQCKKGVDQRRFNTQCFSLTRITCCTQSLLQKWLREIHFINIIVFNDDGEFDSWSLRYNYEIRPITRTEDHPLIPEESENPVGRYTYDSYEEALEKGLFEALKLIK